ncbi:hypothetical protein PEX2_049580 [Penicillium expansum]|uniref:Neprosin PEP catalytic domain-containing protein n=1 Tax=Penicillium expansum TaxID=27334 RepID=A0A0A2JT77_PENEN|nr:hypothetical protein PEX2_049580 [Penicillium expansum]KGO55435.1 hypothetical protein PEX2_049580 [Penicillium expansum]
MSKNNSCGVTEAQVPQQRAQWEISATTTLPDGRTIDWIPICSQGEIAELPAEPPPNMQARSVHEQKADMPAVPELEMEGIEKGPPGTVPVLRGKIEPNKMFAPSQSKPGPPLNDSMPVSPIPGTSGIPRVAGSHQIVKNFGAGADFSTFAPEMDQSDDYSLIEIIVENDLGAFDPSRPREDSRQAVEVGWVVYPSLLGTSAQLFTFFTTCGYKNDLADYNDKQGWNSDVTGWIQTDDLIFPGTVFENSVVGGDQYKITARWRLDNGNWWLWVRDRWIGYYPAKLFRRGRPHCTLSDHADGIYVYGQVWDSKWTTANPAGTKTDMGSGRFPTEGFKYSSYIKKIKFQPHQGDQYLQDFDSTVALTSDRTKYDAEFHFKSGSSEWGSYMWVGGPGRL